MPTNTGQHVLAWAELPPGATHVTLGTFYDDEGDYSAPTRVGYPATNSRPARAYEREGGGWVKVTP